MARVKLLIDKAHSAEVKTEVVEVFMSHGYVEHWEAYENISTAVDAVNLCNNANLEIIGGQGEDGVCSYTVAHHNKKGDRVWEEQTREKNFQDFCKIIKSRKRFYSLDEMKDVGYSVVSSSNEFECMKIAKVATKKSDEDDLRVAEVEFYGASSDFQKHHLVKSDNFFESYDDALPMWLHILNNDIPHTKEVEREIEVVKEKIKALNK